VATTRPMPDVPMPESCGTAWNAAYTGRVRPRVTLNIQVLGDPSDPAVLMLHGNPVDHRILRAPMERLFATRPGWRRVYVDLPGFGASPASEQIRGSDDVLAVVLGAWLERVSATL
jgi:pimeloyl-ACP methyl ester carboxylesterase